MDEFDRQALARYPEMTAQVLRAMQNFYAPNGRAYTHDATGRLTLALISISPLADARAIARQTAKNYPPESQAHEFLTEWWLKNLRQDEQVTDNQRIGELSWRVASAPSARLERYYEAELAAQLVKDPRPVHILPHCWKQLELGTSCAAPVARVLDMHAVQIAAVTPDAELPDLLYHSHRNHAPALYKAAADELHRTGLAVLRQACLRLRPLEDAGPACTALTQAYQTKLAQTPPGQTWAELVRLDHDWKEGAPAILSRAEAETAGLLKPGQHLTLDQIAHDICALSTTDQRRASLATAQEGIADLPPCEQLNLLGALHAILLHQPDLARPSRERILELHAGIAEPAVTAMLLTCAIGDPVLQSRLQPPGPAPAAPATRPGLLARLKRSLPFS